MDSKMKCVAIMLAVGASAAMASISLDFAFADIERYHFLQLYRGWFR